MEFNRPEKLEATKVMLLLSCDGQCRAPEPSMNSKHFITLHPVCELWGVASCDVDMGTRTE